MSYVPTMEQAREILRKYNKEEFHLKHGEILSGVMRYFAKEYDPGREEFWAVVGILHDLDFEMYPEEHCVKGQEIMKELDLDESLIRAAMSHGFGCTGVDVEPEDIMEKVLYASIIIVALSVLIYWQFPLLPLYNEQNLSFICPPLA